MDRQITEQIVDNALLNDKEGFMSAFQAAMATKVADALEVKKVEVASNMLGAAEVAAQEDTLEEEVEQIDEGLGKTIKRGLAGWGAFDKDKPSDVVKRVKNQNTDTLKMLSNRGSTGRGSPAELQQKVISRELNKRGVAEEVEQVDEAGLVSSLVSAYFRPKAVAAASRLTTKVARKFGASPQTQRRLAQGASNWASSKFAAEEVEQIDEGAASHHGVAIDNSRLDKPKNISGLARKHGGQHVYRDPHGSVYVFSNKDGAKSFKDVVGSAASHIKADQTRKIMKMKELGEDVEQIDEAKTKMTDAHKKIAKQVHRDLKSDEPVGQAYGFRVRQMHTLLRKKYGSNWRALAGIKEEVEQIDEMEKDVSGPGRDGDGAHFTGSKDKKPVIKMTGKERKTSDALAGALKRLAAKKLPKPK